MKKMLGIILVTAMSLTLLVGCGQESDVLKVGTNAAFPPFEYRDESDQIVGFDIDLIEAIAEESGFEVEWVDMDFGGLIAALTSERIDIVAAGMTITEERLESVNFTQPYFDAGQAIVVLKGTTEIESVDDLEGKTVGVQIGTTADIYMDFYDDIIVNQYENYPLAFQDLFNENVDAVVCDEPVAKSFVEDNENAVIAADAFTDEQFGFAVRKGDEDLLEQLNNSLDAIMESGKYDELYDKWFN